MMSAHHATQRPADLHAVLKSSWLMQGLRFGLAIALLATVPNYLIYFAVQPNPGLLVVKQIVFDTLAMLATGAAAAALNRPATV